MKKMFLALMLVLMIAVPAMAVDPIQTVQEIAVAVPSFNNSGIALGNALGSWGVGAVGSIDVTSYAQGTKSANATSFATGTAFGIGGAAGIQTPSFGIGASGAIAGVYVAGAGYGLGIDKNNWSFFDSTKNPDSASVGINYSGEVVQGNGIIVNNGTGTFAGGNNQTGATFSGGSSNLSYGKLGSLETFGLVTIPALAIGADGAGALAGGYTIAGYVDTPNFAAAGAKTVGFSGYVADQGTVSGNGLAQHQAIVNNGSYGLSGGLATFNYAGTGSLGYGIAETSGWTKIQNTPNSSSVTSFSTGSASATVK